MISTDKIAFVLRADPSWLALPMHKLSSFPGVLGNDLNSLAAYFTAAPASAYGDDVSGNTTDFWRSEDGYDPYEDDSWWASSFDEWVEYDREQYDDRLHAY